MRTQFLGHVIEEVLQRAFDHHPEKHVDLPVKFQIAFRFRSEIFEKDRQREGKRRFFAGFEKNPGRLGDFALNKGNDDPALYLEGTRKFVRFPVGYFILGHKVQDVIGVPEKIKDMLYRAVDPHLFTFDHHSV